MATINLRSTPAVTSGEINHNRPLTNAEIDANFHNLNAERGAVNGVASLDSDGKLPVAQLPTTVAQVSPSGELLGPDGPISVGGFGSTTLTVGEGGQYATIQAAIDYIEAQGAFTPLTVASAGAVTTWAQGASTFTPSTLAAIGGAALFVTPVPFEKVWFKAADDAYYYPLEDVKGVGAGVAALQGIGTIRRIEASISTAKALTWFKQNDFVIYLLDDYHAEDITISADVCVTFSGNGRNSWAGEIIRTAGFKSGKITFSHLIVGAARSGGMFTTGWSTANTIALEVLSGTEVSSVHDDWIYPSAIFGSLRIEDATITQQPTAVQGHVIAGYTYGDIVLQNVAWRPISHASTFVAINNVFLIDCTNARNVILNGVSCHVRDKHAQFADVAFLGSGVGGLTANIMVADCHMLAPDTCPTTFSIAKLSANSTGCALSINNCSIVAKNTSGAVKLVDADANPAGACAVTIGRGNNILKADTQANITYTRTASSVSGTATVANGTTTVVVTHGLGYAPLASDIQITPTLLSNAAKYWVTTIGATQFTINVDADPGASTATFAWRIAE